MAGADQDQMIADSKQATENSQTARLDSVVELLQRSDVKDEGKPRGERPGARPSLLGSSQSDQTSDSERLSKSDARLLESNVINLPSNSGKSWQKDEELNCRATNKSMIDDFTEPHDTEMVEQRRRRKGRIERNLHNQHTYYEQRNNFESDEASDIQSEIDSNGGRLYTYDEKMRALVKMFIESFVPFHLIHGSYFQNLLRNSFGIRKMPKLVQFKNFFETIHELGTKYVMQTLGGAQSYTLIFEFWKTTNRRHQYVTIRASYIDVFVRRAPILANFKVFHDWSFDKYIDKFNWIFRRFGLQRDKVFAVVTNFKSRQFLSAIESYIGNDKIIFCLIHQFNCKFNELLLDHDYEEDMIHYEEKAKELNEEGMAVLNEQQENEEEEKYFSDDLRNENDEKNVEEEPEKKKLEKGSHSASANNDLDEEEALVDCDDLIKELKEGEPEEDEEEDEIAGDEEDPLAYIKLFEEPEDILKTLNEKKLNERTPATVRVVHQLLKLYAYIAFKTELLDELNEATKKANGYEFHLYYLLAHRNWSYLYQTLFYFKMTKSEFLQFLQAHPDELQMPLSEHDLKIVDDLLDLLTFLVKKMNLLSLEESIGLGKAMNITKYFINSMPNLNMYTEEGTRLKQQFMDFFNQKHGFFERDNFYGIASLLDPKATKYDFKTDHTYKKAVRNLHDLLCLRLDKNFDLAQFKIRAPLRIELEHFHKRRPYAGANDIVKFQLNSPVLQKLVYDYYTLSAICFEPKKINFEVKERVQEVLSQCRSDTLSQVMLLNSLDEEVLDQIITHAKFWY